MELLLDPKAWLVVILICLLGAALSLLYYQVGKRGMNAALSRFPQIKAERWERATEMHDERGSWILILCGVPMLGLLLATVAGASGVGLAPFLFWVIIGKTARNWLLAVILGEVLLLFTR